MGVVFWASIIGVVDRDLAMQVKAANYLMEVDHAIQQEGKHFDSNAPPHILRATQTHTGSR